MRTVRQLCVAALLFKTAALALDAPLRALRAGIDRATATAPMRSATVRFELNGWAEDAAQSLRDEALPRRVASRGAPSDRMLESAAALRPHVSATCSRARGAARRGFVARRTRAVPIHGAGASGGHGPLQDMPLPVVYRRAGRRREPVPRRTETAFGNLSLSDGCTSVARGPSPARCGTKRYVSVRDESRMRSISEPGRLTGLVQCRTATGPTAS